MVDFIPPPHANNCACAEGMWCHRCVAHSVRSALALLGDAISAVDEAAANLHDAALNRSLKRLREWHPDYDVDSDTLPWERSEVPC